MVKLVMQELSTSINTRCCKNCKTIIIQFKFKTFLIPIIHLFFSYDTIIMNAIFYQVFCICAQFGIGNNNLKLGTVDCSKNGILLIKVLL